MNLNDMNISTEKLVLSGITISDAEAMFNYRSNPRICLGLGINAEAVTGVINYLFSNLKKHRIIASVDHENIKSIMLLERIGMRKEAHFKKSYWSNNEWTDDMIYAILEEEWIDSNA